MTEEFLRYGFVDLLLSVVGISQGYAFSDLIADKYFLESQLGNLKKMVYGAMDVSSVVWILMWINQFEKLKTILKLDSNL